MANGFWNSYGDYMIGAGIGLTVGVMVCGVVYYWDRRERTSIPCVDAVKDSVADFKSRTEKKERNATQELVKCAQLLGKYNFEGACKEEVMHFCTAVYSIDRVHQYGLTVSSEEQAKLVKALEDSAAILQKNEFKK